MKKKIFTATFSSDCGAPPFSDHDLRKVCDHVLTKFDRDTAMDDNLAICTSGELAVDDDGYPTLSAVLGGVLENRLTLPLQADDCDGDECFSISAQEIGV